MNLLRLWQITDQKSYKDKADKTMAAFGSRLEQMPEAMPYMTSALDFSLAKHRQIIIAGVPGADDTRPLLRLVWQRYIPNRVLLLADGSEGQKQLAHWLPLSANVTRKQGRATANICENYVCKPAHGGSADRSALVGWVAITSKVDRFVCSFQFLQMP